MIKISKEHIPGWDQIKEYKDIFPMLQNAIMLEHATIPPYLTAMFSIKPGKERDAKEIIHSIVIEEMLHMTIVCNILNAIGGSPSINNNDFIPKYPTKLPMGIEGDLIVNLRKLSKEHVKDTFMVIEEPEEPIEFPVLLQRQSFQQLFLDKQDLISLVEHTVINIFNKIFSRGHATIGQYYTLIKLYLIKLAIINKNIDYKGDVNKQVTLERFYPDNELFAITNLFDALNAINIIIEQGEGTSKEPNFNGELAHYYKFAEIYNGRKLIKDNKSPKGYSYSGDPIPLNPENIYPIKENISDACYKWHPEEYELLTSFKQSYHSLLAGLHITFNGQPNHFESTLGLMFDLSLKGQKLCATQDPLAKSGRQNLAPLFVTYES